MKKFNAFIVFALLMTGNLFAQTITHDTDFLLADIDAWITNTRTIASTDSTQPYAIVSNEPSGAILIYPVDGEKRDSVSLDLYFYVADAATPVNIDVMLGSDNIVDTTSFSNLDSSGFTRIFDKVSVPTKNVYTPFEVTESYNAAVDAGKSTITFLIGVDPTDETNTQLKFRVQRQRDGYKSNAARLAFLRNCIWYETAVDTILCEGTTLNINNKTLTEDGVIVDTVTNECGSDDIYTYYAMFISSDPVTYDTTLCYGTSYTVQIGPRTSKTYTEAGTYKDTITADGCEKIITSNLSFYDEIPEVDLGDDQVIRESESYTLDAGPGSSYVWMNDGKVISGEESQQLEVTMSKDAFHVGVNEVEVVVTDENGCDVGSNVVWVEIKGNLFEPFQDAYCEEISDEFITSTALRVKNDTDIPEEAEEGYEPHWNRETYLSFDLSEAEITSAMLNYRLRLYLYSVNIGPGATDADGNLIIDTPFYQPVKCEYAVGAYDEDGDWASRPTDLTTMASTVNIRIDSLEAGFIEWDINDVFTEEILNKIDTFTVVLSAPDDTYSHLSTYRSSDYSDVSQRPVIVYDVEEAPSGIGQSTVKENGFVLYPNPVSDILHLKNTRGYTEISIYDITGKTLISKRDEVNFVDVSNLKSGVYFIRLGNDVKKFVKK